ncbi:MAG: hypothetical protein B7Z63_06845 [Ignavibacteriae bacterium 37-53-5]|nr:MAG: hypothetical protein B7Z63_06845 [Ignavibacteriae bacterium 37-53-5]
MVRQDRIDIIGTDSISDKNSGRTMSMNEADRIYFTIHFISQTMPTMIPRHIAHARSIRGRTGIVVSQLSFCSSIFFSSATRTG